MKPLEKGWLKEYFDFRKNRLKDFSADIRKGSHPEQSLYRILQPTGLMYGQTAGELDFINLQAWGEKDKMKILLAESLLSSALLFHDKPIRVHEDLSNVISAAVENIANFYNRIFPELSTPAKTLFGKRKSPIEQAEKILEKRIELTTNHERNFWVYFFHNSLLFLDVYIFGQWIHTHADRIVADFFRYERDELRFSLVKVISAASHANKEVVYEEKKLFEFFLQSTNLSGTKRKEALVIFEKGISLEEINLPAENSWILKKFFLEIAILTLWADKKVEQRELDFLSEFCIYLDFSQEDLENSMIAIEGFVLEHWEQLSYLQNKQDYQQVSEQFINRIARLAQKNKNRIKKEIQSNPQVIQLALKARKQELTMDEQEVMRNGLIQVLKSLPPFVIVSLPHRFLTLPILLKILPEDLFSNIA